jgi:predicted transcriptional regulator YdeE
MSVLDASALHPLAAARTDAAIKSLLRIVISPFKGNQTIVAKHFCADYNQTVVEKQLIHLAGKENYMRTLNLLLRVIITITFVVTCGCGKHHKTAPADKTLAKTEKPAAMNYDIREKDAFTLIGLQIRITSADEKNPETFTKIWDAFEPFKNQVRPQSTEWRYYGVTYPTDKKDVFDYLAGQPVQKGATVPDPNLIIRQVPAARYAVFKCKSEADMDKTYQYIFSEWLHASRYKIDPKACSFEQYAPKEWANRPVYIYIPISQK